MATSQEAGAGRAQNSSGNRLRKVLSLDGGGIRGLSSIIILGYLMDQLSEVRRKRVEPWEEFDMIGGTSTGGITAIMLGRLRMGVDECENAYTQLANAVFTPRRANLDPRRVTDFLKANGKFDEQPLEAMIKGKISDANLDEDALFRDEREDACKVFVSVVRAEDGSPSVIRSYPSGRLLNRLLRYCKIWEAARATSAASTFFDPITIGPHGTQFVDGGLRYNNPIDLVDRESRNLWPHDDRLLISIGTGDAPGGSFEGALKDLVDRLKDIATDTQVTSDRFLNSHSDMVRNKRLFRYNVHGLGAVGLDESRARPTIVARTENYLESPEVLDKSEDCIHTLALGSSRGGAWLVSQTGDSAQQNDGIGQRNDVMAPVQRKFEGHQSAVCAVAFSPDGQLLAGGSSVTVMLWVLPMGLPQHTLRGHTGTIRAIAFSPGSRILASGSLDKTLRLWDVATRQWQRTIDHDTLVDAVAFSPDGRLVASGSYREVNIWDVATVRKQRTIDHTSHFCAVAFSPDGRLIGSGSIDTTVRLWDVKTGRAYYTIEGHKGSVNTVAFSPDGRLIVSGSTDMTVRLWDVKTGRAYYTIEGHKGSVNMVAFSPDGKLVASGSDDGTVRLWDVATGRAQRTIEGHTDLVMAVAFSPDGRLVASGSRDCTMRLWDVATGQAA